MVYAPRYRAKNHKPIIAYLLLICSENVGIRLKHFVTTHLLVCIYNSEIVIFIIIKYN